jgi:RHS repeat-associated protein
VSIESGAPGDGTSSGMASGASKTSSTASAEDRFRVSPPQISLPKGGGALRGIGEKFSVNTVTGTASLSVPIEATPGRSGFGPQLSLSYNSGSGNGPFGFGWSLAVPSVTRKTDKGLPRYDDASDSDTFVLGGAEDLVPQLEELGGNWQRMEMPRALNGTAYLVRRYRPRIEGSFMRIERWSNRIDAADVFWRVIARDNTTNWYGRTAESRIADPSDPTHIFSWLLCESYDCKGNVASYRYKNENSDGVDGSGAHERNRTNKGRSANRYLKRVLYGNRTPYYPDANAAVAVPLPADWCFELVLDYGDHNKDVPLPGDGAPKWPVRSDPFSMCRAGFEIRTYRLCRRALMFHHFPADAVGRNCLVRSTDFTYSPDLNPFDERNPVYSFLTAVSLGGYRRAAVGYTSQFSPPLEFEYRQPTVVPDVRTVDPDSLKNLPQGLDGSKYQWVDLDGEGASGILARQGGAWLYKRNLSPLTSSIEFGAPLPEARFAEAQTQRRQPAFAESSTRGQQLLDVAGDGQLDLVCLDTPTPGFFERTDDEDWASFRPFERMPQLNWSSPDTKFIDLTGDGLADLLIVEDQALCWYASLGERGYAPARRVSRALDEEHGPRVVFSDGTESMFLADVSGDGLTDIVRVRNGEVCYWPNLGYGQFGPKVTMENAPWFEAPDLFDARRLRLADIDGSGTADIVYFATGGTRLYFNQSGNGWGVAHALDGFPGVDSSSSAQVLDLLGNGTSCLVWSTGRPGALGRPMRYIDLMGGSKPHLLTRVANNLGAETRLQYAPSTRFYLEDKAAGRPWVSRLAFPVQVVERVETHDYVSRSRFVGRYAYHHGYFDGVEREFRGFGMVEQFDTEELASLSASSVFPNATNIDAASHVPPVLTRTWYHTGLYLGRDGVSRHFAAEYYREPGLNDAQAAQLLLDDTVLPDGWSVEEEREACRALKGSMLRQEVYALDGSAKAAYPYTVTEQNFTLERLQPSQDSSYGVFINHAREALGYHYERESSDPRISHTLTLQVDVFGNVLRSLSVSYGRRQPDLTLSLADQKPQVTTLITLTDSDFTPAIDLTHDYLTPMPSDTRLYEVTGFQPAQRFTFEEWVVNNFQRIVTMPEIPYETVSNGVASQKRLVERMCTRYRRNDLTALLPQGVAESQALPGERFKLAFTPGLLAQVYQRPVPMGGMEALIPNPGIVIGAAGTDSGGYVDLFGNGNWWIPSGRTYFDPAANVANPAATATAELAVARAHFFVPRKITDAFGASTTVAYDGNDLQVERSQDALGNAIVALHDYRVMQPWQVTDPNGNRSEAAFDLFARVAGTAIRGKVGEILGDRLDAFQADLTPAQVDSVFGVADPAPAAAGLLQSATTRVIYDFDRFARTRRANPGDLTQWSPAAVATLSRETHVSDLRLGDETAIRIGLSYSDGFGREVQKKGQAEPGDATPATPRWVASGWTIFNNKGKAVSQYEPFFTATHQFEFANLVGISPIVFYDPLSRVVATLHCNQTWEKVVPEAWGQETWDVCDTVLIADPRSDPDVGGFFSRLPTGDFLPGWSAQRIGGALGAEEQAAARKTQVFANTPTLAYFDPLARAFLTIAHNRFKYGNAPVADPPTEEFHYHRIVRDIEGLQRQSIDSRGIVAMRYDYDVAGNRIRQASVDGGERWMLVDVNKRSVRAWDSQQRMTRTAYDVVRRPVEVYLHVGTAPAVLVGRTIYGESLVSPEASNLRAKAFQSFDQSGQVTTESFDFKGNLLKSRRQVAQDYTGTLDWSGPVPMEGPIYLSTSRYDALNRVLEQTMPDNSAIRFAYNIAGLLERVAARLRGAAAETPFVTNINYSARGQRTRVNFGNGATTDYVYDPQTLRLVRLTTTRAAFPAAECIVQDLEYTYDPAGNITFLRDDAQDTIFFRNRRVEPNAEFIYDSIGRLIEASGREHLGQANGPTPASAFDDFHTALNQPGDGNVMGQYVQRYSYDASGNILFMRHEGLSPAQIGWRRCFQYALDSNRLLSTSNPALPHDANLACPRNYDSASSYPEQYQYDPHGNAISMPHLSLVRWDYRDQLKATARQVAAGAVETTWYVYDAGGQRVRKVTELANGQRKEDRLYLAGFELFTQFGVNALTRETLHVMDDKQRVALVETRTDIAEASLLRFQFGGHMGSALVELLGTGDVLTYEEYYPFGATSYQGVRSHADAPKRYRFNGLERDEESGLDYCQARYLAPWLGRWISADPAGEADGTNLYRYARDNPIKLNDPSGTDPPAGDDKPRVETPPTSWMFRPLSASFGSLSINSRLPTLAFVGNVQIGQTDHLISADGPGRSPDVVSSRAYLHGGYLSFNPRNYQINIGADISTDPHFTGLGSLPSDLRIAATLQPQWKVSGQTLDLLSINAKVRDTLWSVNLSGNVRLARGVQDLNAYLRVAGDLLSSLSDGSRLLQKLSDHATNTFGLELNFKARLNLLNAIPSTWATGRLTPQSADVTAYGLVAAPAGSLFSVTAPLIGAFSTHSKGDTSWNVLGGGLVVPSIENISKGAGPAEMFPTYGFARASLSLSKVNLGFGPGTLRFQAEGAVSVNEIVKPTTPQLDFNKVYDIVHGQQPSIDAAYRASLSATYTW